MAMAISPLFGIVWAVWGPHWVFWMAAASALFQLAAGWHFSRSCNLPEEAV
jgi:hypothetical protein